MKLGIDVLQENKKLLEQLKSKKISFLGHDASVDFELRSSLEVLIKQLKLNVVSAFGPQHGFASEKQDNMIESNDFLHAEFGIPVHSLYGETRKPCAKDIQKFDILLVDVQDIGCRIYTYITTLLYMLEACAKEKKSVWILDRPNPVGRNVEGFLLNKAFVSFVGGQEGMMFQHGLTLGEVAQYFLQINKLDLDLKVVKMEGYDPNLSGEWGWPQGLGWVNPSPNIPRLSSARVFPGSVLLEGTNLSEGRGTTRPLELWGHPCAEPMKVIEQMQSLMPSWMEGARLRRCAYEPTFHKFQGKLCRGFQVHVDGRGYSYDQFRPFRMFALLFKVLRKQLGVKFTWRQPPYEYEDEKLAIDLLSGSTQLRQWVDDDNGKPSDLEALLLPDEAKWREIRESFLLYR